MSQQLRTMGRALASVGLLAALVTAVPFALVAASMRRFGSAGPLHGVTAPWRWVDGGAVSRAATEPLGDDTVVDVIVRLGLIAVWVTLAVVLVTTIVETAHLIRHRGFSMPSVRGLGWAQAAGRFIAAGLIVLGPLTTVRGSHAAPPLTMPVPVSVQASWPAATISGHAEFEFVGHTVDIDLASARTSLERVPSGVDPSHDPSAAAVETTAANSHVVARGDSVYSIAARLAAGDPARTVEIADGILDLNLETTMSDGQTFTNPAYIEPGWVLVLPSSAESAGAATGTPVPVEDPEVDPAAVGVEHRLTHQVEPGDTLSSIAEEHLGDASDWPEVWEENAGERMADGRTFDDPNLILPGWRLDLPGGATSVDVVPASPAQPAAEEPRAEQTTDVVVEEEATAPLADDDRADATEPSTADAATPSPADMAGPSATTASGGTATTAVSPPAAVAASVPPSPTMADGAAISGSTASTTTSAVLPGAQGDPGGDGASELAAGSPLRIEHAAMLAAGILGLVGLRRHLRMRSARPRSRLPEPSTEAAATERRLRAIDPGDRAERVDVAVRAAAYDLSGSDVQIGLVAAAPEGGIELRLTGDATLTAPWQGDGAAWTLPGDVPVEMLAENARRVGAPCVALVQIGVTADGADILIDLEASGDLTIVASGSAARAADAIVTAIAAGLAGSIHAEIAHLITISLPEAATMGHRNAHRAASVDAAFELAADLAGSTLSADDTTFALRSRQTGGEMWEPAVILLGSADSDERGRLDALRAVPAPGHGLAVVRTNGASGDHRLVACTAGWVLEAFGCSTELTPIGLPPADLAAVTHLLDEASRPLDQETEATGRDAGEIAHAIGAHPASTDPAASLEMPNERIVADATPFAPTAHDIVVGLMGPVTVTDVDGSPGAFERSKTVELIAWLATHRENSTRIAARTALWELDVRDATFANVVSEARRGLARLVPPKDDAEWLARTLNEQLPLHPGVITDADLIRERVRAASAEPPARAIETLRPAVDLVRDAPFAGSSYLWPDAEGLTSNLVLLAMSASAELAAHALATDDIELVFWATARGLKVLPGHEELIGLRMKAHARAGDLSGVRCEWEAYERVIVADAWSDGEPAPKLLTLRHELLNAGG